MIWENDSEEFELINYQGNLVYEFIYVVSPSGILA